VYQSMSKIIILSTKILETNHSPFVVVMIIIVMTIPLRYCQFIHIIK